MTAIELGFPPVTSLGDGSLDPYCVQSPKSCEDEEEIAAFATSAADIFKETGFVILKAALDNEAATEVHEVCKDLQKAVQERDGQGEGNRNPGRYSLGATVGAGQCLHLGAFTRRLVDNVFVLPVLDSIFDQKKAEGSEDRARYVISGAGGDYCLGNTAQFQKIHSDKSAARPLAPHRGDSSKGPIHSKDVPPLISVNYVVQDLTQWNGAMRIVTWKDMEDFGPERAAPNLEQELNEVPKWLSSKIFPLQAGDALIRDVRVWHGGCPNLSGEARFLPSIEVMSRDYFDWNHMGKGCKGRGKSNSRNRHAQRLMPEDLFNILSNHAKRHCGEIVARNAGDPVNSHIDDMEWLREDLVKPARDPYLLAAVKSLEESDSQDMVKVLIELERYAKAGVLSGTRYDLYNLINGWYNRYEKQIKESKYRGELRRAVETLLKLLVGTPDATHKENNASQKLFILLYAKLFPSNHGRSPLSPRSAPMTNTAPKLESVVSSVHATNSASSSSKLPSGSGSASNTSSACCSSELLSASGSASATNNASSSSEFPSGSGRSCATNCAISAPKLHSGSRSARAIGSASSAHRLPSGSGMSCATSNASSASKLHSGSGSARTIGSVSGAPRIPPGSGRSCATSHTSSASKLQSAGYGSTSAISSASGASRPLSDSGTSCAIGNASSASKLQSGSGSASAIGSASSASRLPPGSGRSCVTSGASIIHNLLTEFSCTHATSSGNDSPELSPGSGSAHVTNSSPSGLPSHGTKRQRSEEEPPASHVWQGAISPFKRSKEIKEQEIRAASRSKDSLPIGAPPSWNRAPQPQRPKISQPAGKTTAIADSRVIGRAPIPKASSGLAVMPTPKTSGNEASSNVVVMPRGRASSGAVEISKTKSSSDTVETPRPAAKARRALAPEPKASSDMVVMPEPEASRNVVETPKPQASSEVFEMVPPRPKALGFPVAPLRKMPKARSSVAKAEATPNSPDWKRYKDERHQAAPKRQ